MEMKTLHYEMSELVHGRVQQINRTRMIERKTWTVPIGSWDVAVMRGKVLEKTTTTRIILATKHPETGEDTRFYAAAGSDHEPGARAHYGILPSQGYFIQGGPATGRAA